MAAAAIKAIRRDAIIGVRKIETGHAGDEGIAPTVDRLFLFPVSSPGYSYCLLPIP
jgi:hypothetical protein